MARFKVLVGKHSEKGADGKPRIYSPGEVVDSKSDLLKFNGPGMQPKFEALDAQPAKDTAPKPSASAQPKVPPRNEKEYTAAVDRMTLKELQDHAAEEEIVLKDDERNDINKLRKILKAV